MNNMINPIYSIKVELRDSPINGVGAYAKEPINKGEIVFVKNGHILSDAERYYENALNCDWPISDGYILGARTANDCDLVRLLINHSCNPNCGLVGLNAAVAMRDIKSDEEITFDYAMLDNEDYCFECNCGSKNCRKKITGFDWKLPKLQERYSGYFSNYIQEKIDAKND